jgi:hypothetical protein
MKGRASALPFFFLGGNMASYVYKNKNSVDPIFEYDGV